MPSPTHVQGNDKGWQYKNGGESSSASAEGRKGIALEVDENSGSYLSPSRLMANMGINNTIRDYLPSQPGPSKVEEGYASWQEGDLGDGSGKRPLLLISTPEHVLQIFAKPPTRLPQDQHVKERFAAPVEVISISTLAYSAGIRKPRVKAGAGKVMSAKLIGSASAGGPLALLLIAGLEKEMSSFSLAMLSLRTGEVIKRVEIGDGQEAALSVSSKAVVVAMSHPTPSLHFFHPTTLVPLQPALTDLPPNRFSIPTFALSGRLLAYTTSEPPRHTGKDGLGTLITSATTPSRPLQNRQETPPKTVMNSAVNIGGGVARGVWAGIKMGAQAASRATNGRMATSAPTHSTLPHDDGEVENRSLDDSSVLDESSPVEPPSPSPSSLRASGSGPSLKEGGEWIKIIDLTTSRTIAHFKLPPPRHAVPNVTASPRRVSDTGHSAVSHLAFSPDGATLFAAPISGRSFHLFEIHPHTASPPNQSEVQGEVWHSYELRRGNTVSEVVEMNWSSDGRWIGVATGRGTVHVFAINLTGGPATSLTHTPDRLVNSHTLQSLSTIITPSARLRMRTGEPIQRASMYTETTFAFSPQLSDPLRPGTSILDLAIYRSSKQQVDLARLSVSSTGTTATTQSTSMGRRGSGLTEMMKARVGTGGNVLDVTSVVKVTWSLPPGQDGAVLPATASKSDTPVQTVKNLYLAYAEIQSFSSNPHLLPLSIYLSHQIDFFDAKPIDDYSRLSILDREARTRRLQFRPEVEIRPPSSQSNLDEPLITAIHSVIESSPSSELPYLPNEPRSQVYYGYGSWKSIPIQQVKDGMGQLRSQYAHRRRKRQTGTGLSFEDDAVFADDLEGEEGLESESSPMSSGLPTTEPEGDEEWGVRWEDEYRQAVEDDGGPDDLVLGLMDEQQEERRKWVEKQRGLAREFEADRQVGGLGVGGGDKRAENGVGRNGRKK